MTQLSERHVGDEIVSFLEEQFPATTSHGVGRDVDLFDTGVIDSVGVAETLAYIEDRYQVEIPDEVLLSDDFTTIDGIARAIVALVAGAPAGRGCTP
jgi:acyl carrier protein